MKNEKTKRLPCIGFSGNTQELIEIEIVLIMLGYNRNSASDERWNDLYVTKDDTRALVCYTGYKSGCSISYYDNLLHTGIKKEFKASEIEEAIEFVENYNLNNN